MIAEALPLARDVGKLLIRPLAEQLILQFLVVLGVGVVEPVEHLADGHLGIDLVAAAAERHERLLDHVVLVPDLADELLDDVLHGHDAEGAAVVVGNDGEVGLAAAELGQHLGNKGALVHEHGLVEQGPDVHGPAAVFDAGLDVFADLQDADHVVNAVGVHGQAAVALLAHVGEDVLRRIVHVHGGDVHARRDDALDRHLGKRQGRAHELAALGGQLPVVGHVFNDVGQLILRHGHGGLALDAAGGGVAEGGEHGGQGFEEHHEKPQRARRAHGQPLGVFLGDALRQHLSCEEHDHGRDERAGGDGPHAPLPLHGHGHERRDRQVQNVRADQQRRDRLIEVVEHIQRLLGAAVAVVSGGFEPDAARGCKRCLHDGEIGRAKEQHDDNRQNIP